MNSASQPRKKNVCVDGFWNEGIRAGIECLDAQPMVALAGHEQYGSVGATFMDLSHKCEPIHVRHSDIADDGIVIVVIDEREGRSSRTRGAHLGADRTQS